MCACKRMSLHNRNAMEALNDGRLDEAVAEMNKAIAMAWARGSAVNEARMRNNLALVLSARGDRAGAEGQLCRALDQASDRLGTGNRLCAAIARNLEAVRARTA